MKRNYITIVAGIVLALIFTLKLFAFQVRQTQVAVKTTFGRQSKSISEPGLYFRLPWPIQNVYYFDNRIQNFEKNFKLEQTLTRDKKNLLISLFIGWKIADPKIFLERFDNGSLKDAEETLEGLIRDKKNAVVGQHNFADFLATDPNSQRFTHIENEILSGIKTPAMEEYGIDIELLGIKQLGLPESTTEKVFDRMREERKVRANELTSRGEATATRIRAEADRQRQEKLAEAQSKATRIKGGADALAAESFAVFEEEPELAKFLIELKALEASIKEDATIVFDRSTPPWNILFQGAESIGKDQGETH
ncbi:MAG TPA: protease modulator HflC [Verrucomicrobiales bacterium]|nr:protease modulator HflC [Verrucomicrobiales bacterium]HIL69519.1 protease modulator HflC [Verrucomicrobiota bacterium]